MTEIRTIEHKKKYYGGIFAKLDKVSQGCGEIDLSLFGEILLLECEELEPEFEPHNQTFKELEKIIERIRNCEPNPDQNILLAKSTCEKLLQELAKNQFKNQPKND